MPQQNPSTSSDPSAARRDSNREQETSTNELLQTVLIQLGHELSSAVSASDAGRALGHAARKLIGWDACSIGLYSPESHATTVLYEADLDDGKGDLVELKNTGEVRHTTVIAGRALKDGAFILSKSDEWYRELNPFGNTGRLSESLVFAPIGQPGSAPIGLITIQSYTRDFYNDDILPILDILTSFCASAIERCKAQEDKRVNEDRYRSVLVHAGLIPYERDIKGGRYLFMGEGIRELIGYEASEVTTSLWNRIRREFIGYGHLSGMSVMHAYNHVLERYQKTWEADFLVERPDGEMRWLHDSSVMFMDEFGNPLRSLGVLQDITARKKVEEQLRERERELFSILANTKDLIARFDKNHVVTFVSPSVEMFTGIAPEAYLGKPIEENKQPTPHCDFVCGNLDMVFANGKEIRHEYAHKHKHERIFVQARLIPEIGETGEVDSVLLVVQDITQLKLIEESLRESEHRTNIVLKNMPAMLWTVDEDYRVTFYAGLATETIGVGQEILGKTFMEIVGYEDFSLAPLREHALAMKGNSVKYDYTTHERVFQTMLEPLVSPDGEVVGVIGLAFDVTESRSAEAERLKLQSEIQQSQRLESLGVLAGGIAHDFNNILSGILGNTGIALMETEPGSELHEILSSIERAGMRAADLVRQILAYSGKVKYQVAMNDLNRMIREMLELLRVSISKSAHLQLDLADRPLRLEGDASRIQQVIMNLIVNASDALDGQPGEIRIETGEVELGQEDIARMTAGPDVSPGRFVFMRITDTGCGMDATVQSRIFDPFFTTKFTGRGLGLAAVIGIMNGHSGVLDVTSSPGKGSTFFIAFPASLIDNAGTPLPITKKDIRKMRGQGVALVIDDEDSVRNVLCKLLEGQGYETVPARDGLEGYEMFKLHRGNIRMIFLDAIMPVMNGRETLARIRDFDLAVPVFIMSGSVEDSEGTSFERYPVQGFLTKPFRPGDVAELLETLGAEKSDP